MRNNEIIEQITKKLNGNGVKLSRGMKIYSKDGSVQDMDQIISDGGEWCLASGNDNWVVPLDDLTNKELLYLKKCV